MGLFTPPPDCKDKFPKGEATRVYDYSTKYQYGCEYICLACAIKLKGVYDDIANAQWQEAGTYEELGKSGELGERYQCHWCKTDDGMVIHAVYFGEGMDFPKTESSPSDAYEGIFGTLPPTPLSEGTPVF